MECMRVRTATDCEATRTPQRRSAVTLCTPCAPCASMHARASAAAMRVVSPVNSQPCLARTVAATAARSKYCLKQHHSMSSGSARAGRARMCLACVLARSLAVHIGGAFRHALRAAHVSATQHRRRGLRGCRRRPRVRGGARTSHTSHPFDRRSPLGSRVAHVPVTYTTGCPCQHLRVHPG